MNKHVSKNKVSRIMLKTVITLVLAAALLALPLAGGFGGAIITVKAEALPERVVAINTGGDEIDGGYIADEYFDGGETFHSDGAFWFNFDNTPGTEGAAPDRIYHSNRQSDESFAYNIPNLAGNRYMVRLHLGEAVDASFRNYNVEINGNRVISNFVPVPNSLYIMDFVAEPNDSDIINIYFEAQEGQTANVFAIELFALPDSYYSDRVIAINTGGHEEVGGYIADEYYDGGFVFHSDGAFWFNFENADTTYGAAPIPIYYSNRQTNVPESDEFFSYIFPNMNEDMYIVRLHLGEAVDGSFRNMNVDINGERVISSFVPEPNTLYIRDFVVRPDSGNIEIYFEQLEEMTANIFAIEIFKPNTEAEEEPLVEEAPVETPDEAEEPEETPEVQDEPETAPDETETPAQADPTPAPTATPVPASSGSDDDGGNTMIIVIVIIAAAIVICGIFFYAKSKKNK